MTIREIADKLDAVWLCCEEEGDRELHTAFASDMMSDVLACVTEDTLLLTGMVNSQCVRTCEMLDVPCVIFVRSKEPLADALGLSLADLMHCHDPAQEPPTAPVPLEDFFSMLRRQHTVDWYSVRVAMLRLSIALALWGIFACHGTLAVHWRSLSDGSLQADGWMSSWVVFPLLAGMEFLMLELWNSFEQSGFYHRYLEACTLLDTPFLRLTRVILELLLFFGFGFLVPCAEITIMLFN